MTWLLSKIVANPTVLLALLVGSFLFGVSSGGSAAWWIQSLRVKDAEQEFTAYKQEQVTLEQKREDDADKQRVEAATQYAIARQELADAVAAGDVYRRCVEAGRCGVPRNPPSLCESSTSRSGGVLSAPNKADGSSANAVSLAGDATAINDCAVTTLQLNHLQADIEAQPGYIKP